MPRLLRKKLVCFYCGCRSAQDRTPNIRKWQCEKCEAANYLDENGEITDPPASESSSKTRYAQSNPRAASPEFAPPGESLFCSVCIRNQRFFTETLASYFPPSNAPDYSDYEKNYPDFRKNLEKRYPQVCHKCEPRVRNRIRLTGYAAKSDHLRRMMERTRGTVRYQGGLNWKGIAVSTGATGWHLSQLGQLLWNASNAFAVKQQAYHAEKCSHSALACFWNWNQFHDTVICNELYDYIASIALGLGLLCIWWNPVLKQKLKRGNGRILGLGDYYKLQFIFIIFRLFSWTALTRSQSFSLDSQMTKATHSFMLIFTILSVIISYRAVQFDPTPIILFQDSPGPFIQETHSDDHEDQPVQPPLMPISSKNRSDPNSKPFSIHDLAPNSIRLHPNQSNPPTPPPEENEVEMMDWTPSQQSFPPATRYRAPTAINVQPSPFYGHLPPDPISQAHRLRNPPNKPTFRKASTPQKQSFFQRAVTNLDQDDISDMVSEVGSTVTAHSNYDPPKFNQPRFFPSADFERDTGLESIFSNTFSLADEPHEVRAARENQMAKQTNGNHPPPNPKIQILCVFLLLVSIFTWNHPSRISHIVTRFRFASLGVAATVAGKSIYQIMKGDRKCWSWGKIFIYSLEFCAVTFFGSAVKSSSSLIRQSQLHNIISVFLGMILIQELGILISGWRRLNPNLNENQNPQTLRNHQPPPLPKPQPSKPSKSNTKTPAGSSSSMRTVVKEPNTLALSQRTTRSKSRLENSPASVSGLSNVAAMSALGLSDEERRRSTRRRGG